MTAAVILLPALKTDLRITTEAYDSRLTEYLQAAQQAITREGCALGDSIEDNMLTVKVAAWMWEKRDQDTGLPRFLRVMLNNRIFSQHAQGG